MSEEKQPSIYRQQVDALLSNYVGGRKEIFHDRKFWEDPLFMKIRESFYADDGKRVLIEQIVIGGENGGFDRYGALLADNGNGDYSPMPDGVYTLRSTDGDGDAASFSLTVADGVIQPGDAPFPQGGYVQPAGLAPGQKLPSDWLELESMIYIDILAKGKYGLDLYPVNIEIITAEQMMELYTSVGLPHNYEHWTFGRQFLQTKEAYDTGKMGLAYETVINSNPTIAYHMEDNTPTMQELVTAHAACGHNTFFKTNYMFRQFTDSKAIVDDSLRFKEFVRKCELRYGEDVVAQVLDDCHALMMHSVNVSPKPKELTPEEREKRDAENEEFLRMRIDPLLGDFSRATNKKAANDDSQKPSSLDEENLLLFIAENSPHMEPWVREIASGIAHFARYFFPQRQTQVMNEGCASFWHYTLLQDAYWDLGILSDAQFMEALTSHTNVIMQAPYNVPWYNGINPYALGFNSFSDIRRICENPTEEDREYFPDLAGSDWLKAVKWAVENFKDSSFVEQYLSPKVARDMGLFSILDDDKQPHLIISSTQRRDDFEATRQALSESYDLSLKVPQIKVVHHNARGNHDVILVHHANNRVPLDAQTAEKTLSRFQRLWQNGSTNGNEGTGYRIILHSVDPQNSDAVLNTFAYPPMPVSARKQGFNLMKP